MGELAQVQNNFRQEEMRKQNRKKKCGPINTTAFFTKHTH